MSSTTPITPYLPPTEDRPAEPAPYLLTADEVVRMFRLPADSLDATQAAIVRLKAKGLRGYRIGKSDKFPLPEILKFVESMREDLTR